MTALVCGLLGTTVPRSVYPKAPLRLEIPAFGGRRKPAENSRFSQKLSGPLNRLNAILSLLQPLDRYRAPSAIGSAIGRPYLALSRFRPQLGVLNRPVLNRLGGSTAR